MRFPDAAALAAAVTLCAATASFADALARAQISQIAPSERLRLFAFGKLLESGAALPDSVAGLKQDMVRQGFYYTPGSDPLIAAQAWAEPVLGHDGNINGGTPRDSFTSGGFVFTADPSITAKSGVVVGLAGGGLARFAWAEGRFVEAAASAESAWSPEHEIGRSSAQARLCARNHVVGWTFLDLCQTGSVFERDLDRSNVRQTEATLSTLFATGGGYHELAAGLGRVEMNAGAQETLTLSLGSVWDRFATTAALTLSSAIPDETAQRLRLSGELHWLAADRRWSLELWRQEAEGGDFLGETREDRALGVSLATDLRSGLRVEMGFVHNTSTAEFFDYDQVTLGASFAALQW